MKNTIKGILTALLLASGGAESSTFFRLGADGGGGKLPIVSGDRSTVVLVPVGTGEYLEFGKQIQSFNQLGISVDTELSLGYKQDENAAAVGSVKMTRVMINANRMYGAGNWRLGAGLSFHTSIDMKTEGTFFQEWEESTWFVEDVVGVSAMLDYSVGSRLQFGLRSVFMNYHLADELGNTATSDASTVGMYLILRMR